VLKQALKAKATAQGECQATGRGGEKIMAAVYGAQSKAASAPAARGKKKDIRARLPYDCALRPDETKLFVQSLPRRAWPASRAARGHAPDDP